MSASRIEKRSHTEQREVASSGREYLGFYEQSEVKYLVTRDRKGPRNKKEKTDIHMNVGFFFKYTQAP